jgi:hypothetical protein
MQTLDHDQVTLHIDAPPDVVHALVANVTRTPEFSPEIQRCTWLDGATGPAVGGRSGQQGRPRPGVEEPPGRHRRATGTRFRLFAH